MSLRISPLAVALVWALGSNASSLTQQAAQPQANLPDAIKEKVFEKLGFRSPVDQTFNQRLFSSPGSTNFFQALIEEEGRNTTAIWQTKLLVPKGYLVKRGTRTERGEFNWNEYGQLLGGGIRDLQPTQKLRPYLRLTRDGTATIQLGKRVLDAVDYSNRWQMNGLDTWSFTFSYHIEPVLPDLPRLGPFKGKGSAQINPATGEFDAVTATDVGERFGSALADKGADEYLKWLEGSSGAAGPVGAPTPPGRPAPPAPAPPVIEVKVECVDFDSCLREGIAARDSSDWPKAVAFFGRATSLSESDPRGWLELGRAHIATGDFTKGSTAWDRVLGLGAPLDVSSCLSGLTCKAGRLSLSKATLAFTSEKSETVFSAAPQEFLAKGPKRAKVLFSDKTAVWLELETKAKKWKVSFLPPGVTGCEKTASYLCPDPGPVTQEAVAGYVKERVAMLARGEVPKLPPVSAAPPPKPLRFASPVRPADATQSQPFGAPSTEGLHAGVDFTATRERAPAYAIADGVVAEVVSNGKGCSGGNGPGYSCEDHGLGNVVIIEHTIQGETDHVFSLYGHLESIAPSLEKGSKVAGGDVIGVIGASGYGLAQYWRRPTASGLCGAFPRGAACVHLHLEMKDSAVLHNPKGGNQCKAAKGVTNPCWGYVPGDPAQFGYRNPANYLPVEGAQ